MLAVQGKDNVKRAQSFGAVGPASLQEAQSCSCLQRLSRQNENIINQYPTTAGFDKPLSAV